MKQLHVKKGVKIAEQCIKFNRIRNESECYEMNCKPCYFVTGKANAN